MHWAISVMCNIVHVKNLKKSITFTSPQENLIVRPISKARSQAEKMYNDSTMKSMPDGSYTFRYLMDYGL